MREGVSFWKQMGGEIRDHGHLHAPRSHASRAKREQATQNAGLSIRFELTLSAFAAAEPWRDKTAGQDRMGIRARIRAVKAIDAPGGARLHRCAKHCGQENYLR